MKPSSGSGDILCNCCTTFGDYPLKGDILPKIKTDTAVVFGWGRCCHSPNAMDFRHRCRLSVWLSDRAVGLPAYATPLSGKLINRHRCRVISKRHRCRSDTDLATPLSGGCFVSAVIQSKNFRHRCRVFCSVTSVSQSSCYPLKKGE